MPPFSFYSFCIIILALFEKVLNHTERLPTMFTGIIKEIGKAKISNNKLHISSFHKPKIGDSIAINGACLSVTSVFQNGFEVQLSHETLKKIAVENLSGEVHLEPALKSSERVEGHFVQGHIDCIGKIEKIEKISSSYDFFISIPEEFIKFVIPKGSIAVDGVSLTVNEVFQNSFRVSIIELTYKETLFGTYKKNRRVNIETDMFARYIYYLFKKEKQTLSWEEIEKITALY